MEIQIKSPNGVKLLTSKKYCPEDINVVPVLQDKTVTPGAAQTVTPDDNYAGLSSVSVDAIQTESGAATPSAAAQVVSPSAGKYFDKFTVNATPTETKTITANGTFTPSSGKFFNSVTVDVNEQKPEQEKTITITANGTEEVVPDEGYALSKVTAVVNVDTAKPEQTKSVDIASMTPVTVTPDTGKVLTSVTVTPKTPLANTADATVTAGDVLSGKTAYVDGAKVTGTLGTQTKSATPSAASQTIAPDAGNLLSSVVIEAAPLDPAQTVTAGTVAKTVSPSEGKLGIKSVTVNPTPSSAKTVTPTKSTQTVSPDSSKLLSSVTVNPIPDQYIVPSGSKTISANGTTDVTAVASAVVNVPPYAQNVATTAAMDALLVAENVGKVYKFTGPTDDSYTNGDLYVVEG